MGVFQMFVGQQKVFRIECMTSQLDEGPRIFGAARWARSRAAIAALLSLRFVSHRPSVMADRNSRDDPAPMSAARPRKRQPIFQRNKRNATRCNWVASARLPFAALVLESLNMASWPRGSSTHASTVHGFACMFE